MGYKSQLFVRKTYHGGLMTYGRWRQAAILAEIARDRKLYVEGWHLIVVLNQIIIRPLRSDAVALLRVGEEYVALAVVTDTQYHVNERSNINVFCHPDRRRKDYGSACVRELVRHDPKRKFCPYGDLTDSAKSFYDSNGILKHHRL